MIQLRDYQKPSVEKAIASLQKHGCFLDAAEMGTGKTPKAATVAARLGLPVGVICPLICVPVWHHWLREAGVVANFILNYEQLRTGNRAYGTWIEKTVGRVYKNGKLEPVIDEAFFWNLNPKFLLIFDEVHNCKGIDTRNGKMLSGAKGHSVLMLSATPMTSPLDCRHTGKILGLHDGSLKEFYQFAVNYGAVTRFRGAKDLVFYKNDDALRRLYVKIYAEKGDRITIAELGDQFPKNEIIAECYNFPGVKEAYNEALEELKTNTKHPLAIRTKARMEAERLKIPFFLEKAREAEELGRSCALFVNFRETCEILRDELHAGLIYGNIPDTERNEAIETFQANRSHFIVCQTGIGAGFGLHDLHGRPRTTILSPTDSVFHFTQCLGRTPRDGALSPSLQYIPFAAGTIEVTVCQNVNRKKHNLHLLTNSELEVV